MAQIDLAGALTASASLGGSLAWNHSGTFGGLGDVSGSLTFQGILGSTFGGIGDVPSLEAIVTLLVGGQTNGVGEVTLDTDHALAGVLDGLGELLDNVLHIRGLEGVFSGNGTLLDSTPLVFYGVGDLVAYVETQQWPPPVCPPSVGPSFLWRSEFGRCGLTLRLCDEWGVPYSPTTVLYALYQVMPGGYRLLRGSFNHRPVQDGVGSYYAIGIAGECGQPGSWVIMWRWQIDAFSVVETREMAFQVLDGANNPCDTTTRVRKFGWNC